MRITRTTKSLSVWSVVALTGLLASCNPSADDNRSATLTFIDSLNEGQTLQSDVRSTGASSANVTEPDTVQVSIRSVVKNTLGPTPSNLFTVQFTEAVVTYVRVDGQNEPGLDVPFPITQAVSATIVPGGTSGLILVVVTDSQKQETPLRNLWFGGGDRELSVTAFIELRGRDLSGNVVQATGQMPILFGDF